MAGKSKKNKRPKNEGLEVTTQLLEYILAATLLFFSVLVPLYTRNGYYQIGDAKFAVYKYIMLTGFGVFLICFVAYLISFWTDVYTRERLIQVLKEKKGKYLSITDWFVIAYFFFVILSVFAGGYYQDALWGYPGWCMGFLSQLSFVLLYFAVSRFGRYWKAVLWVLCMTAALVFWFGVLHRLMIDPLGYYEGISDVNKAQFLSTLGQASWYASFLAVVLPLGIGTFLFTEKKPVFWLSGLYVFLGFCTLVTQNSDSAYMALMGFMLTFLWFAAGQKESFLRLLWVCTLFLGAGRWMAVLLKSHPNTITDYDFATDFILHNPICYLFLFLFLALSVAGTVWKEKWNYPHKAMQILRVVVLSLTGVFVFASVLLIVLKAKGALPEALALKLSGISYMNWHEGWGNGRGATWVFTVKMFSKESLLHKLFGVGPDCYYSYASSEFAQRLSDIWGDRALTNAHNEWLNMMVNAGILGAAAYIGIFISAARRFGKGQQNRILIAFAASIFSYMAYDFFCYQQVLCTPFLFMILGIGEYLIRKDKGQSLV